MILNKLFRKETLAESAGIVLLFTVIKQVLQTGRGIVFTRVLGPSNYGVYTLAFFFIPLVAAVARLGVSSAFARYVPLYEKEGMLKEFTSRTFAMAIGASILVTSGCLVFPGQLSNLLYGIKGYSNIIIICAFSIVPLSFFECITQLFSGLRLFKLSYSLAFAQFILFTIVGIILVLIFRNAQSAVIGNLVSLVIVVILFGSLLVVYLNRGDAQKYPLTENGFYRKILRYSIWYVISPIVFNLFRYTDRWMLNYFQGLHEVGIYSVASNVAGLLFAFGIAVGNVLMPTLSRLWEDDEKKKALEIIDFSIRANTIMVFNAAVLVMLFRTEIITLFYGGDYVEGAGIIGVLLIFWLLNTIYWTIGGYSGLIEKTYIPLICNSAGLISNIILNCVFIPRYGIAGAAAATTIAFSITMIVMLLWYHQEGLGLKLNTMFVCLLPCVFLLNNIIIVIVFAAVLIALFGSELLMTKMERKKLYRQIAESIGKYKKPRRS